MENFIKIMKILRVLMVILTIILCAATLAIYKYLETIGQASPDTVNLLTIVFAIIQVFL